MTQYKFSMGTTPLLLKGDLTWNSNGTLRTQQITDQIVTGNSQTCNYGYDDLVRIASANCGAAWSQTFGLDPFGNLSKSGSVSFQPTYSTSTNRIQSIPGAPAPTYDAGGNLLTITDAVSHNYVWDGYGKQVTIDTVGLTYDALGRLVEQNRSGVYTQIVYSPTGSKFTLMSGTSLSKAFLPLPGGGTAVYNLSGLQYYRHGDLLGSSRLATTPSRTKYFDGVYAPYGEDYLKSGTTDLSFTGQNQDTVAGLYDFMYREYNPVQGRWLSPDPAGVEAADPGNPQSWNRYAYVLNNPLKYVDPTGLDCAYLTDSGNGIESIDTSSNINECGEHGGFWVDGTLTRGWYSPDSNDIYLQGNDNGQFTDSYSNTVTSNSGNTSIGLFGSSFPLVQDTDVLVTPTAKAILNRVGQMTGPFTKQFNCGAAAAYPFLPGPKPEDFTDLIGLGRDVGEKAADAAADASEAAADQIKNAGRIGPSRLKRIANLESRAKGLSAASKVLSIVGYGLAAKQGLQNYKACEAQE